MDRRKLRETAFRVESARIEMRNADNLDEVKSAADLIAAELNMLLYMLMDESDGKVSGGSDD